MNFKGYQNLIFKSIVRLTQVQTNYISQILSFGNFLKKKLTEKVAIKFK